MQKQGELEQYAAASCWGKVKYENRGLASEGIHRTQRRKKLRGAKKRNKKGSATMMPYFCKFCGGWHIGH